MSMTEEKYTRLNDMLTSITANEGAMNDWERGFIQSQLERVQKYGQNVFMSEKQWNTIVKIYTNVTGDDGEAEQDGDPYEAPF